MNITTDRDAKAQIINAIEATGVVTSDEYDIDRILRLAFDFQMPHGFRQVVSVDEFWEIVRDSEKAPAEANALSYPREGGEQ